MMSTNKRSGFTYMLVIQFSTQAEVCCKSRGIYIKAPLQQGRLKAEAQNNQEYFHGQKIFFPSQSDCVSANFRE